MLLSRNHFRIAGAIFLAAVVLFSIAFYQSLVQLDFQQLPQFSPPSTLSKFFNFTGLHSGSDSGGADSAGDVDFGIRPKVIEALYAESSQEIRPEEWRIPSETAFRRLRSCLATSSCLESQEKVIIVESMYFRNQLRGDVGGEEIYAHSTIAAMVNLGYTVLYVESLREAVQVYRLLPELVKIVIVDDWKSFTCWKDKEECLRNEQNPTGIPGYKLLSFYFWPFPRHPLGPRWILSPEPYRLQTTSESLGNNTYLGYSIEDSCRQQRYLTFHERPSPPRAWLLAKLLSYFIQAKNPHRAWSKYDLDAVVEETGVQLMMAASSAANTSDDDLELALALPDQYRSFNLGRIQQSLFMEKIAESKVVIGMGLPLISPTPWNALCLGVPYINPVYQWDPKNPEDPSKWRSQHPIAALLPEPYVYNVRKGDRRGLISAVKKAVTNPIASYVPERMRLKSIEKRMVEIVDTDWEAEEQRLREWCKGPCGCQEPCDAHMFGDIY
ncbi:hypothetical protein C8R45DRAFT_811595 [Mycena sanguinolenta]|nr:hypothetical protein C8R45DRAFT_811595 [Mycena sanguinolenta]